jgi:predicted GIY-YIG superfamily endonuclease
MAPSLSRGMSVVYFLRLRSGSIYVGASIDLEQRLGDHLSGQACRTTQLDPVMAILRVEVYPAFAKARQREAQLKRWSRAKKLALIRDDHAVLRQLSQSRD